MIGKNNPFNIRYNVSNHWLGQIGKTKGFCDFSSLDFGVRAALYLVLKSYRKKRINTIRGIIERFAPSFENNTVEYINFVSHKADIPCDFKLITIEQYFLVLAFMSVYEGNSVSVHSINRVFKYYFKNFKL